VDGDDSQALGTVKVYPVIQLRQRLFANTAAKGPEVNQYRLTFQVLVFDTGAVEPIGAAIQRR
jgi:hypothetical protein